MQCKASYYWRDYLLLLIINSMVLALDIYLNNQLFLSLFKLILVIFCKFVSEKSTGTPQKWGCFRNISIQRIAKTHIFGCSTHMDPDSLEVTFSYCMLKNGISCSSLRICHYSFVILCKSVMSQQNWLKFVTAAKF